MTAPKPWRRRVSRSGGVPLDFVTDAPQLAAGSFTEQQMSRMVFLELYPFPGRITTVCLNSLVPACRQAGGTQIPNFPLRG